MGLPPGITVESDPIYRTEDQQVADLVLEIWPFLDRREIQNLYLEMQGERTSIVLASIRMSLWVVDQVLKHQARAEQELVREQERRPVRREGRDEDPEQFRRRYYGI